MMVVAAVVAGSVAVALWPDRHDVARWRHRRAMRALQRATRRQG